MQLVASRATKRRKTAFEQGKKRVKEAATPAESGADLYEWLSHTLPSKASELHRAKRSIEIMKCPHSLVMQ